MLGEAVEGAAGRGVAADRARGRDEAPRRSPPFRL